MKKKLGFTLIELLVVIAIIALLIAILLPSLSRARELSKRAKCAASLKSNGQACEMYSNDNKGSWPVPAHNPARSWIDPNDPTKSQIAIYWRTNMGGHSNAATGSDITTKTVDQKYRGSLWSERLQPDPPLNASDGAIGVSVSRALWMLIREKRVDPKIMICPSSDLDRVDPLKDVNGNIRSPDDFYDFHGYRNLSYSYQIPFGPGDQNPGRASSKTDSRMIVMADKGPFANRVNTQANQEGGREAVITIANVYGARYRIGSTSHTANQHNLRPNSPPEHWKRGNSPNHGGRGNGEGQNAYRIDGSVTFYPKPCVGIDDDNIYLKQFVANQSVNFTPTDTSLGQQNITNGGLAPWWGELTVLTPGLLSIELVAGSGVLSQGTTDSYLWP